MSSETKQPQCRVSHPSIGGLLLPQGCWRAPGRAVARARWSAGRRAHRGTRRAAGLRLHGRSPCTVSPLCIYTRHLQVAVPSVPTPGRSRGGGWLRARGLLRRRVVRCFSGRS